MQFLIALVISLAIEVVAYLIEPKPQTYIAEEKAPTADAGRPIPWVFGEVQIQDTNILWVGELQSRTYDA